MLPEKREQGQQPEEMTVTGRRDEWRSQTKIHTDAFPELFAARTEIRTEKKRHRDVTEKIQHH